MIRVSLLIVVITLSPSLCAQKSTASSPSPSLEQRVADLEAYINNSARGADGPDLARLDHAQGGAPDLAIEILAPSNSPREITERLEDFFSSGSRLAWIIHPNGQFVEICRSPIKRRIIGSGGLLDGALRIVPRARAPG